MRMKGINKNHQVFKGLTVIVYVLLICLSFSCVTQKNVEYLKEQDSEFKAFKEADKGDYKIKPHDELYIQISSLDDPSANIFSSSSSHQLVSVGTIQPFGASLLSYSVNKDGAIYLPVIGSIIVKDMTLDQVTETIHKSLEKVLSQPMVTVKLVNRFVTVLGEVQQPGHYNFSQDKVSIYDAIGLAGDITEYGNRSEVILIRNKDGNNIRILIDLTNADILQSDNYLLNPNDIIYVKPLRKKFWALSQFPYSIILSAITAGVLFYSIVN